MHNRRTAINPHKNVDVWMGRVCLFLSGAVFVLALDMVWRVA